MTNKLLDLDRIPTIEELKTQYKENDFSTTTFIDINSETMSAETAEDLKYIKDLMNEHWEPMLRQLGMKAPSCYYSKDNPVIALRDGLENSVATGLMKLVEGKSEQLEEYLIHHSEQCLIDPGREEAANQFLQKAVETLMEVTEHQEIINMVKDHSAYEDYNHAIKNNLRAKDHDRQWGHTRAKTKVISVQGKEYENLQKEKDAQSDAEKTVEQQIELQKLRDNLSEEDKLILEMRKDGHTQKEIAQHLGYNTPSVISKRFVKFQKLFLELNEPLEEK